MRPRPSKGWGWVLIALALLAVRDWIILGHPLPLGSFGSPDVLLANKLQGWFHMGTVLGRWSWQAWGAGLLWEWLPAVILGVGTWRLAKTRHPKLPVLLKYCPRGPWLPTVFLFTITTVISLAAFEGIPHVQDSIAQQFQAQVFASGRAWAPVPPAGWLLRSEYMVQHEGRWFAQYPPGHAAVLALGTFVGVPWLVCPILAGASALLLYASGVQLYGSRTATTAVWLFCLSPFVWFMSGERMNHTSTLLWVLVALNCLSPALRRLPSLPGSPALFAGGLALGLAVSTRPLCGLAWTLVAVGSVVSLLKLRKGANISELFRAMLAGGSGLVLGMAPMLVFNAATIGSPWTSGYELQWGSTGWGFGQSQWGLPHTLSDGLGAAWSNWDALGKYLFEWPLPSTVLLLGCACLPRWRRADRLLLASLIVLTLAYVPYFFQDLCLGPRFLYAGLPAVVLLSARGTLAGAGWLGKRFGFGKRYAIRSAHVGLAAITLVGLGSNGPVLWQWYNRDFWGTSTSLVREVDRRGIRNAVVFIRDRGRLRCEELRHRGVPLSVAQAAVDALNPEWIDEQIARFDRAPEGERQLVTGLTSALADPRRRFYRTSPPWIEPAGPSSNVNYGIWANTPAPESQGVIYALHPDRRLTEVLPTFRGRSFWTYDWDPTAREFRLIPIADPTVPATSDR